MKLKAKVISIIFILSYIIFSSTICIADSKLWNATRNGDINLVKLYVKNKKSINERYGEDKTAPLHIDLL